MPKNKKRVVLEKVKDERYIARFDLCVHDPEYHDVHHILASAHAYTLGRHNHIILIYRTLHFVRLRTFDNDKPFDTALNVPEAEKGLYKKLRAESPDLIRRTREFHSFYDETGMGRRYNHIKSKATRTSIVVAS